ncbi:MAG TPA: aquaporin, partial [Bryobacteraceae bacterium]|nr:aquaporin [Bryobacteraceae bacterium]
GALAVGSISGGVFNPGVALGISLMGLSSWSHLWIYLLADFLGAATAAGTFNVINRLDHEDTHGSESTDRLGELSGPPRRAA